MILCFIVRPGTHHPRYPSSAGCALLIGLLVGNRFKHIFGQAIVAKMVP